MNDNFGVCFTFENIAVFEQFFLEDVVVFDDAVVDQGDFAVHRGVWMRIDIRRFAVGSPTRVTNCRVSAAVLVGSKIFEVAYLTNALVYLECSILIDGNTRAVIAAVF